jgi:hypothetical protein
MSQLSYQSLMLYFYLSIFCVLLTVNSDYFLKNINHLNFVMVKCRFLFEVQTEFLNII